MTRDANLPLTAQILIYPVIDYSNRAPSYDRYGQGYGVLETAGVDWFMDHYLPETDHRTDWRAVPSNATSHTDLPPALVLTAECDVLHDDAATYAHQLIAAGTSVTLTNFAGMTHGFFNYLGLVDAADQAHQAVADFLEEPL
jgi:acetyl esterase